MRRSSAFTLIEVMAAVVLLALFVAAISGMLVRAQAQEGDARRRARAAAFADRLLAELDEAVLRGGALTAGTREMREGELVATTTIAAFEPATLLPAPAGAESAERAAPIAAGWLAGPEIEATPPIYEIALHVTWDGAPLDAETQRPYGVQRRTFALNPAALETLASTEDGDAGGENDEGDDE